MGKRSNMPDRDVNLLLTSGLILLISLILAAMAYFSLTLGIINPPGTSSAPNRVGTHQNGGGVANPNGATGEEENAAADVGDIIFPGFVDFSITDGRDYVDLSNNSQNKVYFKVVLTDSDGQVLYANETIQPGASERWQVTSAFDPGTGKHDITATVDAYGVADDTPYNGIISTFTVDMG